MRLNIYIYKYTFKIYVQTYIHTCAIWWTVRKIKTSTSVNYLLFVIVVVIVVTLVVVAFVVLWAWLATKMKFLKSVFKCIKAKYTKNQLHLT